MTTDLMSTTNANAELLERVVVGNDLSKLSAADRLTYYRQLCQSLDLNPLTRPFQYITLSGRLTLYATKDATEQLRKKDKISITKLENHRLEDVYIVTAYAKDAEGREDSATGAVPLLNLKGEALANALMKAETKAKRRVTLSICGLGMLDETEVGSIPDAKIIPVDPQTGELPAETEAGSMPGGKTPPAPAAPETTGGSFGSPEEEEPAPVLQPNGEPVALIDRAVLIGNIKGAADKARMTSAEKAEYQRKYLGGASVEKADLAALSDLLKAIREHKR